MTALGLHSTYAANVLPPLLLAGLGTGPAIDPAISLPTYGVNERDAGVASAAVNVMQQIGGSVGTALFNTMATTAVTTYLTDHPRHTPQVLAEAGVHGYATAYGWAAAVFALGGVATLIVYPSGQVKGTSLSTTA
ncbi:hypothetical protein ACFVWZ_11590 [Streptomyces sp. NPDC058200]|uniref:hypothetical protein n=1 Tax=Streptomyces sp. NPDC058200 TaxID=3346378 RepID=UPI0036EB809D